MPGSRRGESGVVGGHGAALGWTSESANYRIRDVENPEHANDFNGFQIARISLNRCFPFWQMLDKFVGLYGKVSIIDSVGGKFL